MNPMIGSRVQQTCSSISEEDAGAVRNREGVACVTLGSGMPMGLGLGVAGIDDERWRGRNEDVQSRASEVP